MTDRTLDLYALESFVLGLELGSFARAAERLGRSTSAVSAQLKSLEDQIGSPIVQKLGRGLVPTPRGEVLLGYARRLLALNAEAVEALSGCELEGAVRLGLQEDFGDQVLTAALGTFARAHPRVRVEARVARNAELLDGVQSGTLDLALAWDSGLTTSNQQYLGSVPLRWLGNQSAVPPESVPEVALAVLDAPCVLRSLAQKALDQAGRSWRIDFVSASLGGVWAAVRAGLGVTVRTKIGLPPGVFYVLGLPELPSLGLILHRASPNPAPGIAALEKILLSALEPVLRPGGAV